MAHNLNCIITSFKYKGELPNLILVGNYHIIPLKNRYNDNYMEKIIEPYEEFTLKTKKIIKELSFYGKCAYIETDYFGGVGIQISEIWENGVRINKPLISYDGVEKQELEDVIVVENSINETLKNIGIKRHKGKDEFDTVRLGNYRSNEDIFEEFYKNQKLHTT